MYGALRMRAAVLAARAGMPEEAADRVTEARAAASHVPDGIYYGTAFGPSSVRVHELATAVEAGDTPRALRLAGRWQPPRSLPGERRSLGSHPRQAPPAPTPAEPRRMVWHHLTAADRA